VSIASLSLDLDNRWSYMKTHGDPGWDAFPSYLDTLVPRVLELLARRRLTITVFVVGQDAAIESNVPALRAISSAGHEIGNHSFRHEPWLQLYSAGEMEREIATAEHHIEQATGVLPVGFRGPGFSLSNDTVAILARRGYLYDASTFPTFIGPLARAYYFWKSDLGHGALRRRGSLFGHLGEGFRPLRPYRWRTPAGELVEIPVTTMPGMRLPFHLSYIIYLASLSRNLALGYFRSALAACRLAGVQPSLLLHPLDFLGCDDGIGLEFFPGMNLTRDRKLDIVNAALDLLQARYDVVTMSAHAQSALGTSPSRVATVV
jgi:peptidoglycan-N-acetylglucosamine deacetylase